MEQSKIGYYTDYFLYPMLIVIMSGIVLNKAPHISCLWLCCVVLGVAVWTIVEYGVHRFALHSIDALERLHQRHHATPSAYVGTPTWASFMCFALGGFLPTFLLFGREAATGATTGLMLGYLWYLVVHDAVHRRCLSPHSLLYRTKMRHLIHHRANVRGNFGVTSSFWDGVFGTYVAPSVNEGRKSGRRKSDNSLSFTVPTPGAYSRQLNSLKPVRGRSSIDLDFANSEWQCIDRPIL